MSRVALVALVVLGALMAFCLYLGLYEPPEGEWRDVSGHSRGYSTRESDLTTCSSGPTEWDDSPDQAKCMGQKSWVWHEFDWGNTGPANTGRAVFLFGVFPILAVFFAAIALTKGVYRRVALYALGAVSVAVGCYVLWVSSWLLVK